MRLWGLASAGCVAVGSVFAPARDQGRGFSVHAGVVSDALPASDASIEPALANAGSSGISHLRVVASREVPLLGPSAPGVMVVRHLRDGASLWSCPSGRSLVGPPCARATML